MIIRTDGDSRLFITQPDHARLAAEAIARWHDDGFATHPRRDVILLAAREHDNGWLEEDEATYLDQDGVPLDFVSAPLEVRQRLWPRAVDRVALRDPYAAALIAQHAMTVYAHYGDEPVWTVFFETLGARRAALLERCGGRAAETLAGDYGFVHAGDRISLAFCTGWTTTLESRGRQIILAGNTVEVRPDPFAGARVPLRVRARRLTRRSYASSADLRAALDAAEPELLEGFAIGR